MALAFHYKLSAPGELEMGKGGEMARNSLPLLPFREMIGTEHTKVREVEVLKAIYGQSSKKSPGPDLFPAELYKKLSVLKEYTTAFIDLIIRKGVIPKTLKRIYLVPITKPGKDPRSVDSRRPIALLCVIIKILETVVYHRLLPVVEPHLTPCQYAYRRGRGTEFLLIEVMDRVHRALLGGQHVYLASFDIRGAFDTVPHSELMAALKRFGVDVRLRKVIHEWLRGRTFQVRMRSDAGVFYSSVHTISRGLPQGGVLSPFLWLIFFNPVIDRMRELRMERGQPSGGTTYRDFVYADDITSIVTAGTREELIAAAHIQVECLQQMLKELSLSLNMSKCMNLYYNPVLFSDGIFMRPPDVKKVSTRTRLHKIY